MKTARPQSILKQFGRLDMNDPVAVPPGHALVTFTRVDGSSMKTTTRVSRGRRCSLRRYHMAFAAMPGVVREDRPRAYAYADGDLSHEVGRLARHGSFDAIVAKPHQARVAIVAVVDPIAAAEAVRRARRAAEDAAWEAAAPRTTTTPINDGDPS